MKIIAAAFLALLGTVTARAQEACPVMPKPAVVTAAVSADGLGKALLMLGQTMLVVLHPTKEVSYPTEPEKLSGAAAQGGLVAVMIPEAGTWQVSLNSGAWIDVLQNGIAVTSTAHGHAFTCSGLRKVVDFPLAPGRVVIQISANVDPSLIALVSRKL
jgi:hypothetical protein